ncbi:MAG: hypothetical protein WBP45_05020 [Daejeonella sp.]
MKLLCFFLLLNMGYNCSSTSNVKMNYGEIATFKKGRLLSFPDFDIEYTGIRKETSHFNNGHSFTFTLYDFLIKKNGVEKTISWSPGTGDIGPQNFEFNDKKYTIELKYSINHKKRLDDDEFVINKSL